MFLLLLLLALRLSPTNTCPTFCQCFSSFDGYHVTCQNSSLYEIPFSLIKFLQTTEHQNLIVDLSSNFLSVLSCHLFQISTIISLILTNNQIQSLPTCFSHSSIETLLLNHNNLHFNQTTILVSSKLIHLDLSYTSLSHLPRTFLFHLRRLRTLILTGEHALFEQNHDQWIRSLTTRNQLTIRICDDYVPLPLCLFDSLFQSKKLVAIELNTNIHCDCSLVYLPLNKIHFHYCQSHHYREQTKCHVQSSRFEHVQSLNELQAKKYRQLCAKEYQTCQNIQLNPNNSQLVRHDFDLPSSDNQSELISSIKTLPKNNTTTVLTETSSKKKENISAGAIIPFVLVLLVVTIVCLYVILSGHFFQMKNGEKITGVINRRKKQQDISSIATSANTEKNPTRFDECIPIENLNMNSNRQNSFLPIYHQRRNSYSDEESELTFYSINNNNDSSTSFIQTSMTEIEIISLTSTLNSSLSHETVIISHPNKSRI